MFCDLLHWDAPTMAQKLATTTVCLCISLLPSLKFHTAQRAQFYHIPLHSIVLGGEISSYYSRKGRPFRRVSTTPSSASRPPHYRSSVLVVHKTVHLRSSTLERKLNSHTKHAHIGARALACLVDLAFIRFSPRSSSEQHRSTVE